jgi:hypothetical protein
MKTNDLIEELANGLAPVRPLQRPEKRVVRWLLGSVVYLGVLAFVVSRFTSTAREADTSLLISQLIGVVAGVFAAVAAFASVIPGYSRRALIGSAAATAVWLAVFVFFALGRGEGQLIVASQHEWVCVAIILVGGGPLIAALAAMLRVGAPLNPSLTGLLSALAVGLLANFGACISLSHDDYAVTLVWHGGAVALLAGLCVMGAHTVLRWDRR